MQEKEYFVPIEDLWNIIENKYKALVIIQKEARRIFQVNPQSADEAIIVAIKRFVDGEIEYKKEKKE